MAVPARDRRQGDQQHRGSAPQGDRLRRPVQPAERSGAEGRGRVPQRGRRRQRPAGPVVHRHRCEGRRPVARVGPDAVGAPPGRNPAGERAVPDGARRLRPRNGVLDQQARHVRRGHRRRRHRTQDQAVRREAVDRLRRTLGDVPVDLVLEGVLRDERRHQERAKAAAQLLHRQDRRDRRDHSVAAGLHPTRPTPRCRARGPGQRDRDRLAGIPAVLARRLGRHPPDRRARRGRAARQPPGQADHGGTRLALGSCSRSSPSSPSTPAGRVVVYPLVVAGPQRSRFARGVLVTEAFERIRTATCSRGSSPRTSSTRS